MFSFFLSKPMIFSIMLFNSIQFSCSVVSSLLQPYGLQDTRLPCLSPTPRACSNSCPLIWWCHPTIASSVVSLSSCLQSFPASGSFPMSQFFTSGGQNIGASAFPLCYMTALLLQSNTVAIKIVLFLLELRTMHI